MKKLVALLIVISLFILACTPPGANLNGAGEQPVEEPVKEEAPEIKEVEEEPEEEKEEEPETPAEDKKVQCTEGEAQCKEDRLIVCRSGKLIQKEVCGLRGCFDDHCGECVPGVEECVGNDLVTCSEDGRKTTKKCFKCANNVCEEAPENPEPLECAGIKQVDVEGAEALSVYSPFKKDHVDQQILVMSDDNKLGEINHKGQFFDIKGPRRGKHPIYFQMERCYFQCVLQFPVQIKITCDDGTGATGIIPPNIGFINNPTKFFLSKDGSMYYGDSDHTGEGTPLSEEEIFTKEHLAAEAPR